MILKEDPKAYAIMGCAMRVHEELGFGFLESAYGDALEVEFAKAKIPFRREDEVRIFYDGKPLKTTYRADFTCFNREYIIELKAIKTLSRIEWAQVIHYIRATRINHALLINFGRKQIQYDTFDLDKLPFASIIDTQSLVRQLETRTPPFSPWKANGSSEAPTILRSGSESRTARSFLHRP